MKTALAAVSVVFTILFLAACETEKRSGQSGPRPGQTNGDPTPTPTPPAGGEIAPTPEPTPTDMPPAPEVTPTPVPTPAVSSIPYGTPVPGKPGFVISPHSNEGYVDVQGIPPNTEVKDPYSGKIFRVP